MCVPRECTRRARGAVFVTRCVCSQRVYQAGEKRWGTDENTFNMVLASQSYEQLRAVFDAYGKVSGKDIEHAIKCEMSGDLSSGMLTIGEEKEDFFLGGGMSVLVALLQVCKRLLIMYPVAFLFL